MNVRAVANSDCERRGTRDANQQQRTRPTARIAKGRLRTRNHVDRFASGERKFSANRRSEFRWHGRRRSLRLLCDECGQRTSGQRKRQGSWF